MTNKYKNALNTIAELLIQNNRTIDCLGETLLMEQTELEVLQELVDKATPKKPIEMVIEEKYLEIYVVYQCPNCKKELFSSTLISDNRFCRTCGQALDWSENE